MAMIPGADRRRAYAVFLRALLNWNTVALLAALVFLVSIAYATVNYLRPPAIDRLYQEGLAALATGDLASTRLMVEALSASQVPRAYSDVLQAGIDLRLGRVHSAAARLPEAMQYKQTAALAHAMTGEALYKNRQFGAAIEVLRAAVELDDTLVDAHRWLAASYYDIGATGPAVKSLARVSALAPNDPRPHRLTGLIYKDMESYEPAIDEYREALRRSREFPDRQQVLKELAECLLETGKHQELEAILDQCPLDAGTLTFAAESLHARGDTEQAIARVDRALAMDARFMPALLLKATFLAEQSQVEEAIDTLRRAVELNPLDNRAHYQLSQAYARRGDKELAEKHAAESVRLRDLRVHFTDLHAQASENVNDARVRYELGVTARQLGRPDLAMTWLSAALALQPDYSQAAAELESLASGPAASNK